MRSTLFFCTFLFVQLAFSQDFIRTSSIRINSDLQYYTDFYKKIYEYNGLNNLNILVYQNQREISDDEYEVSFPSLIKVNDQYLTLNLGTQITFEIKELVGGQFPELLIYSQDEVENYHHCNTYIVNISLDKGFVLSDLGAFVSVIEPTGKVEYFSSDSETLENFEYQYLNGPNDLYILYHHGIAEEGENCYNFIEKLNYNEHTGFTKKQIMKKLLVECAACFTGQMEVNLNEIQKKPISELKVGDKVLTFDFEKRQNKEVTIEEMIQVKHIHFITYIFDHDTITATPDHPFYLENKGWASSDPKATTNRYKNYPNVGQIAINDEFTLRNGKKAILRAMNHLNETNESYTISKLSEGTSFYINDVLVGTEEIMFKDNKKIKIILTNQHPVLSH